MGNRRERGAAEIDGEVSIAEAHDPNMSNLFASSLGPVKSALSAAIRPALAEVLTTIQSRTSNDIHRDRGRISSKEVIDEKEEELNGTIDGPALPPSASDSDPGPRRRRKRNRDGDDIEGMYMQRVADEDSKSLPRGEVKDPFKRQKLSPRSDQDMSTDEDGPEPSNFESSKQESNGDPTTNPQHESLLSSKGTLEIEKAARTVFLGNVSTLCIKSKSAKKTLIGHLSSFCHLLPIAATPHKVESLRFRSTPFSTGVGPKKAAYAKKELMDSTTTSTNAYAVYTSQLAAREAMKKLNGKMILNRHLLVDSVAHPRKTDHRRCVFIGNLGFVDDESQINAAKVEDGDQKPRKVKEPSDVEEGLWKQFSKAGVIESVRVVRDSKTRVGKGFAYIQFKDEIAVEKALLYNDKRFPPLLPRILRVTRAKKTTKTSTRKYQRVKNVDDAKSSTSKARYVPKVDSVTQSLSGRAGKLFGHAGAARLKDRAGSHDRRSLNSPASVAKAPEQIIFEGYRASSKQGKGAKFGSSGKKAGKPRTRSSQPPSLQLNGLNGLFQTNMGLNGLGTFTLDPVSPSSHQNGVTSDGAGDVPRTISPTHDNPSRPSLANSRRFQSQPLSGANIAEPSSPTPTTFGTPNSDQQDSPWSSAVGRATTGKSGRVIERLMADNDRLRRDKNLIEVRLEEESKRSDSARSAMEGLRSTNENLTSIRDTDKVLLTRRERKLEEMKLELEAERQRREKAESETKETRRERDEAVEGLKKEVLMSREQAQRAITQYDVISKSFKGLGDNYARQTRMIRSDMKSFQDDVAADHKTMASYRTVVEHYRSESERAQDANARLNQTFEAYKVETEEAMRSVREEALRNVAMNERLQQEMKQVLGDMRYVLNLRQNVRDLHNDAVEVSPPQLQVFASLFSFSDEARHELSSKLRSSQVEFQWSDNKHLTFIHSDEANTLALFELYAEYINTEKHKAQEPYEVAKLERTTGTHVKQDDDTGPAYQEAFNLRSEDLVQLSEDPPSGVLIHHETISRVWTFESPIVTQLPKRRLKLDDIGKFTGCTLVLAEETSAVTVKGDNDQSLDKAVRQLENLERALSALSKPLQSYHFLNSEAAINVQLQIRLLDEVKDQVSTTILRPGLPHASDRLKFGLVLMLNMRREVITRPNVRAAPGQAMPADMGFWQSTPVLPYGDQSIDFLALESESNYVPSPVESLQPALLLRNKEVSGNITSGFVKAWVEQSSNATNNPFEPAKDLEDSLIARTDASEMATVIEAKAVEPQEMKKRHKRSRKAPGGQEIEMKMDSIDCSKAPSFGDGTVTPLITVQEVPSFSPFLPTQAYSHNLIDISVDESIKLTAHKPPVFTIANPPFSIAALSSSGTRSNGASQKSTLLGLRSATPSTHVSAAPDLLTGPAVNDAPMIDSPFMPPDSSQASVATDHPTYSATPEWLRQNPTTRASIETKKKSALIDQVEKENESSTSQRISYSAVAKRGAVGSRGLQRGRARGRIYRGVNISYSERVQSSSEVLSRQVHQTMNQKMAKPPGQASLLKGIESAAIRLLQSVRAFKGVVTLEVDIGRILIKDENNAIGRTFTFSEWSSVFASQSGSKVETMFTDILPMSDNDVQFLANLKQSNGRQIFAEEPRESGIHYHILCSTKSGDEEVILKVNNSGCIQVLGSQHLVGAVHWHFPKRQWDARLAVKIREQIQDYQDSTETIAKTLSIVPSPSQRTGRLFAELGENSNLIFKSANIVREITFRCLIHPDIIMSCSEVQYLGPAKEATRYCNAHRDVGAARKAGHLWWEVRLRSRCAGSHFQQNMDLVVGNEVDWKAENMVKGGIVKQLHSMASEIVTKIDGIGFSINDIGSEPMHSGTKKEEAAQEIEMGPPPAKRRRKTVVSSSEDEENPLTYLNGKGKDSLEDQITNDPSNQGRKLPNTRLLPTRLRSKNQPTFKTPTIPTAKSTPSSSPKKVKSKRSRNVAPKSLDTYFGAGNASQRNGSSVGQASAHGTAVEEHDFIEDDLFDEELRRLSDPRKNAQGRGREALALSQSTAERGTLTNFPTGSQIFRKAASNARKIDQDHKASELRKHNVGPWADRYGPTSTEELAVHKKKVSDVKEWLENKLLILKGASGVGKTATISALARNLELDVLEWKNPTVSDFASENYLSTSSQFEDFLGRSSKFATLHITGTENAEGSHDPSAPAQGAAKSRNTIILVEEFPNITTSNTIVLQQFRISILRYLARDPVRMDDSSSKANGDRNATMPLVMVITESQLNSVTFSNDSFTAHRLLGADILNHPNVDMIEFNAIAPTIITKALDLVIQKEARDSGRRRVPGLSVLKRLGEVGDIRSAIASLEFLCLKNQDGEDWGGRMASKGKKGAKNAAALTKMEKEALELVTQREASLGLFHAVGKVIYNKREGPGEGSPFMDPPPQPPDHLPQHTRLKPPDVSVDGLVDQTGTDTQTFVAALHENYVLSCAGNDFTDTLNDCIEYMSNSDVLISERGGKYRGNGNAPGAGTDTLRQDEIAFQVAVRGLLFSLPCPVKRSGLPSILAGKSVAKGDAFKMFYPSSMRLGRQMQEVEEMVERWTKKQGRNGPSPASFGGGYGEEDKEDNVASWAQRTVLQQSGPEDVRTNNTWLPPSKDAIILETMPYTAVIEGHKPDSVVVEELERITRFTRRVQPARAESPNEFDLKPAASNGIIGRLSTKPVPHPMGIRLQGGAPRAIEIPGSSMGVEGAVSQLYLSDDDIED
ncbi:MAG: hypothetical protein Q9170_000363 [Blastenia crenularia]